VTTAAHVAQLKDQLANIDTPIALAVRADEDLSRRKAILESVPGVGEITAAVLIAELPELGAVDDKKIAALVGVAPVARDSGILRGQRHTTGGRAQRPLSAIHGYPRCRTIQPRHQSLSSASSRQRQTPKGRPRRRHAQIRHLPQHPRSPRPTVENPLKHGC
jgi:transposase